MKRRGGFPKIIRVPRYVAPVRVLMENGIYCDKVLEVIVPSKTYSMRDPTRRPRERNRTV